MTDASAAAERTALKEWAVLADAMGRGDIVAMVRKGGIRERRAGFVVRHERFLVLPTFFHEKSAELAERFRPDLARSHAARPPEGRIRLSLVATVAAVWRVTDLERMRDVSDEHGLAWDAVASRFHYRDTPLLHLVAVRVARLHATADIPEARRYGGCVSWVELDEAVDVGAATPAVAAAPFAERVARLRAILGDPTE